MNYRTNGIIVKRMNFSEADRILTVFTERFGKVKAMARGVRKVNARMAGSLEPFMLVDLQLYEGKTFYTVTGASIVENYPQIHTDLTKMADVFYVGELVDKFEKEKQKSASIFSLVAETMRGIEMSDKKLVIRAFEIKLLKEAGFWPDLSECLHCKAEIEPEENYWDGSEGGLICRECQQRFHHGRAVSSNVVKLFRFLEAEPFSTIVRLKASSELEVEVEGILSVYLRQVLETDLKTSRFVRSLA